MRRKKGFILKKRLAFVFALAFLFIGFYFLVNKDNFNKSEQEEIKAESAVSLKKENKDQIVSTAKIGSMGDLLMHSPILDVYYDKSTDSYNFEEIFTFIASYIKDLDYAAIDLEGSLAGSNYSGYPLFRFPDNIIDSAKKAGFDMFLIANNHSNDGGFSGFLRTMQILREKGVDFIGSREKYEDKKYFIKEINGIKIGMVNYTYGEVNSDGIVSVNGIPSTNETSKLINVFDYNKLENFYSEQQSVIERLKKDGAEAIVYYMHWGNEYQLEGNSYQKEIAQKLCDLGVDAIVGGHPHVIEPIETFVSNISKKSMVCLYSMGNAVSNQRVSLMDEIRTGHTEDGVVFNLSFSKFGDGSVKLSDVDILPTWVHLYNNTSGKRSYQIVPLDKSVDWGTSFNLNLSSSGVADAGKSYNRTIKLLFPGLEKIKNILKTKGD